MNDESKSEDAPRRAESARQLLSAAGLLVAALTILGLGAVLAVDPKTEPPPQAATAPTTIVVDETPEPLAEVKPPPPRQPVAPPPTPAPPTGLAARAASDARRLARGGGTYTLQLLVGCKEETVERYLRRDASGSSLYLLPASVGGQSCFRVSFGSYASLQEATAAAKSLPAELTTGAGTPAPKKIADLLL